MKKVILVLLLSAVCYAVDNQYNPMIPYGFQDYDAHYLNGLSSSTYIQMNGSATVTGLVVSTITFSDGTSMTTAASGTGSGSLWEIDENGYLIPYPSGLTDSRWQIVGIYLEPK